MNLIHTRQLICISFYSALLTAVSLTMTAASPNASNTEPESLNVTLSHHDDVQSFHAYEIIIDTGSSPLAAWQIDLSFAEGHGRIVGIEGQSDESAFQKTPRFDREAIANDRIIMADFSLEHVDVLPTGQTRLVTISVATPETLKDQYQATVMYAVDHMGTPIDAELIVRRVENE